MLAAFVQFGHILFGQMAFMLEDHEVFPPDVEPARALLFPEGTELYPYFWNAFAWDQRFLPVKRNTPPLDLTSSNPSRLTSVMTRRTRSLGETHLMPPC